MSSRETQKTRNIGESIGELGCLPRRSPGAGARAEHRRDPRGAGSRRAARRRPGSTRGHDGRLGTSGRHSRASGTRIVPLPATIGRTAAADEPVGIASIRSSRPRSRSTSRSTSKRSAYRRSTPGARTIRSPDWLEPRAESDDVSFPVIQDRDGGADDALAGARGSSRKLPPHQHGRGATDDDDDNDLDDEIEVDDELGSSDLEILDDDLDLGSPADPDREPDDGEPFQPRGAAGRHRAWLG